MLKRLAFGFIQQDRPPIYGLASGPTSFGCLGFFWIKFKKIKPKIEANFFKTDNVDGSAYEYPMVLVQIPMCNEREVNYSSHCFHV